MLSVLTKILKVFLDTFPLFFLLGIKHLVDGLCHRNMVRRIKVYLHFG